MTIRSVDLGSCITQEGFGSLVGITQPAVSSLLSRGVLPPGGDAGTWLAAYCEHLREGAAGRDPTGDLTRERARLASEQADRVAMQNEVMRGQYAPIGLLADVLAAAAAGVVDRFDQLEGALKKACPDLPEEARTVVMQVIASARNEWVRATATIAAEALDRLVDDEGEPPQDVD